MLLKGHGLKRKNDAFEANAVLRVTKITLWSFSKS